MPVVAKCPNCNGPLDKAPTGPEQKCPYCGATLLATRFMPSPAAPPPGTGAFSPPGNTAYPPPAWGTGSTGQPYAPPPMQPMPVLVTHHRSVATYLVSSVVTMLVIGGAVFAMVYTQQEVSERTQQAVQSAAQAAQNRTLPIKLTPVPYELGKEVEIDLPASTFESSGRVVATLDVELPEETLVDLSLGSDSIIARCRMKALDASGNALVRSEEDSALQLFVALPKGPSQVIVDCDSHPAERSVQVLARPIPILLPDGQVEMTLRENTKSVAVLVAPETAGLYAVALVGGDSLTTLSILESADVTLGKQDVDLTTSRAVLEVSLKDQGYLVVAGRSSTASSDTPLSFAVTRIDPEPVYLGTPVTGALTRFTARRYYTLRLDAPMKIEAAASAEGFRHSVEIRRADGVAVVTSDEAQTGRNAKAVTTMPLDPGEYRIAVWGEQYSVSEGEFTLKVEAVVEPPPTKRGSRRGTH